MRKPLETILKNDVQKIFDNFSSCFDIRILFYTPGGDMPQVGLNQPDSAYCALIQNELYGAKACLMMDQIKREEAAQKGEMICYQCHAGLVEAIKPVYFERHLLGFIAIGQFRSNESIPENVMHNWQNRSIDPLSEDMRLQTAYASLPYVPRKKIDDILGLFSILVDYIVSRHMITLKGNVILDEIISHMELHANEDITLPDVARIVHKSPSTVSHLFNKKLGKSFKNTLIEMKLRKAEEQMTNNPDVTVGEAAATAGYDDPLYFSRIYRRHRGVPPSEFLKQCKNNHNT